jgi:hypothetical protein
MHQLQEVPRLRSQQTNIFTVTVACIMPLLLIHAAIAVRVEIYVGSAMHARFSCSFARTALHPGLGNRARTLLHCSLRCTLLCCSQRTSAAVGICVWLPVPRRRARPPHWQAPTSHQAL